MLRSMRMFPLKTLGGALRRPVQAFCLTTRGEQGRASSSSPSSSSPVPPTATTATTRASNYATLTDRTDEEEKNARTQNYQVCTRPDCPLYNKKPSEVSNAEEVDDEASNYKEQPRDPLGAGFRELPLSDSSGDFRVHSAPSATEPALKIVKNVDRLQDGDESDEKPCIINIFLDPKTTMNPKNDVFVHFLQDALHKGDINEPFSRKIEAFLEKYGVNLEEGEHGYQKKEIIEYNRGENTEETENKERNEKAEKSSFDNQSTLSKLWAYLFTSAESPEPRRSRSFDELTAEEMEALREFRERKQREEDATSCSTTDGVRRNSSGYRHSRREYSTNNSGSSSGKESSSNILEPSQNEFKDRLVRYRHHQRGSVDDEDRSTLTTTPTEIPSKTIPSSKSFSSKKITPITATTAISLEPNPNEKINEVVPTINESFQPNPELKKSKMGLSSLKKVRIKEKKMEHIEALDKNDQWNDIGLNKMVSLPTKEIEKIMPNMLTIKLEDDGMLTPKISFTSCVTKEKPMQSKVKKLNCLKIETPQLGGGNKNCNKGDKKGDSKLKLKCGKLVADPPCPEPPPPPKPKCDFAGNTPQVAAAIWKCAPIPELNVVYDDVCKSLMSLENPCPPRKEDPCPKKKDTCAKKATPSPPKKEANAKKSSCPKIKSCPKVKDSSTKTKSSCPKIQQSAKTEVSSKKKDSCLVSKETETNIWKHCEEVLAKIKSELNDSSRKAKNNCDKKAGGKDVNRNEFKPTHKSNYGPDSHKTNPVKQMITCEKTTKKTTTCEKKKPPEEGGEGMATTATTTLATVSSRIRKKTKKKMKLPKVLSSYLPHHHYSTNFKPSHFFMLMQRYKHNDGKVSCIDKLSRKKKRKLKRPSYIAECSGKVRQKSDAPCGGKDSMKRKEVSVAKKEDSPSPMLTRKEGCGCKDCPGKKDGSCGCKKKKGRSSCGNKKSPCGGKETSPCKSPCGSKKPSSGGKKKENVCKKREFPKKESCGSEKKTPSCKAKSETCVKKQEKGCQSNKSSIWEHCEKVLAFITNSGAKKDTCEDKKEVCKAKSSPCVTKPEKKEPTCGAKKESSCGAKKESSCGVKKESTCGAKKEPTCGAKKELTCGAKKESSCGAKTESTCGAKKESTCGAKKEPTCGAKKESSCGAKTESTCGAKKEPTCGAKKEPTCEAKKESTCGAKKESTCGAKKEPTCGAKKESSCGAKKESSCGAKKESSCGAKKESTCGAKKESTCEAKKEPTCGAQKNVEAKKSTCGRTKKESTCGAKKEPTCGAQKNIEVKKSTCGAKKDVCQSKSTPCVTKPEKKESPCGAPSKGPCLGAKKSTCGDKMGSPKKNDAKKVTCQEKKESPCKAKSEPSMKKAEVCGAKKSPCEAKKEPCGAKKEPCGAKKEPCGAKKDTCKPPSIAKSEPCMMKKEPCGAKKSTCGEAKKEPCGAKKEPCGAKKEPCGAKKDTAKPPCKAKSEPCMKKKEPCGAKKPTCGAKPCQPKKRRSPCKAKSETCVEKKDPCGPKKDPCPPKKEPCVVKPDTCTKPKVVDVAAKIAEFQKAATCKTEEPCKPKQKEPCSPPKVAPKKEPCEVKGGAPAAKLDPKKTTSDLTSKPPKAPCPPPVKQQPPAKVLSKEEEQKLNAKKAKDRKFCPPASGKMDADLTKKKSTKGKCSDLLKNHPDKQKKESGGGASHLKEMCAKGLESAMKSVHNLTKKDGKTGSKTSIPRPTISKEALSNATAKVAASGKTIIAAGQTALNTFIYVLKEIKSVFTCDEPKPAEKPKPADKPKPAEKQTKGPSDKDPPKKGGGGSSTPPSTGAATPPSGGGKKDCKESKGSSSSSSAKLESGKPVEGSTSVSEKISKLLSGSSSSLKSDTPRPGEDSKPVKVSKLPSGSSSTSTSLKSDSSKSLPTSGESIEDLLKPKMEVKKTLDSSGKDINVSKQLETLTSKKNFKDITGKEQPPKDKSIQNASTQNASTQKASTQKVSTQKVTTQKVSTPPKGTKTVLDPQEKSETKTHFKASSRTDGTFDDRLDGKAKDRPKTPSTLNLKERIKEIAKKQREDFRKNIENVQKLKLDGKTTDKKDIHKSDLQNDLQKGVLDNLFPQKIKEVEEEKNLQILKEQNKIQDEALKKIEEGIKDKIKPGTAKDEVGKVPDPLKKEENNPNDDIAKKTDDLPKRIHRGDDMIGPISEQVIEDFEKRKVKDRRRIRKQKIGNEDDFDHSYETSSKDPKAPAGVKQLINKMVKTPPEENSTKKICSDLKMELDKIKQKIEEDQPSHVLESIFKNLNKLIEETEWEKVDHVQKKFNDIKKDLKAQEEKTKSDVFLKDLVEIVAKIEEDALKRIEKAKETFKVAEQIISKDVLKQEEKKDVRIKLEELKKLIEKEHNFSTEESKGTIGELKKMIEQDFPEKLEEAKIYLSTFTNLLEKIDPNSSSNEVKEVKESVENLQKLLDKRDEQENIKKHLGVDHKSMIKDAEEHQVKGKIEHGTIPETKCKVVGETKRMIYQSTGSLMSTYEGVHRRNEARRRRFDEGKDRFQMAKKELEQKMRNMDNDGSGQKKKFSTWTGKKIC